MVNVEFSLGRKFGKREFIEVKHDTVTLHSVTVKCNACHKFVSPDMLHENADMWLACRSCWDS